jgi:predicted ester cyclase
MSIKENKNVVLRFYDCFARGEFGTIAELISPDFVSHRTTGDISAKDMAKDTEMLFTAFPDLKLTVEQLVAEGEKVAFFEIAEGTHKGDYKGIKPTGKNFRMRNSCILKIHDGKWKEAWTNIDEFNLRQQLGVIPK